MDAARHRRRPHDTFAPPTLHRPVRTGRLFGWLGQFPDIATARAAMDDWLHAEDRDTEDAAFILPIIGFGRADASMRAG